MKKLLSRKCPKCGSKIEGYFEFTRPKDKVQMVSIEQDIEIKTFPIGQVQVCNRSCNVMPEDLKWSK